MNIAQFFVTIVINFFHLRALRRLSPGPEWICFATDSYKVENYTFRFSKEICFSSITLNVDFSLFGKLLTLIESQYTALGLDLGWGGAGFRFMAVGNAKTLSDGILLTLIETCPVSLGLDLWWGSAGFRFMAKAKTLSDGICFVLL